MKTAKLYIPDTLYHRTTKRAYASIIKNGLVGSNNGHRAIYLSVNPNSWLRHHGEEILLSVDTRTLDRSEFSFVDPNLDELLYWGKYNGIIAIPPDCVKAVPYNIHKTADAHINPGKDRLGY